MTLFLGTLLIVTLCCLAMGIGLLIHGRPLSRGCGGGADANASAGCAACPRRNRGNRRECPNRGEH